MAAGLHLNRLARGLADGRIEWFVSEEIFSPISDPGEEGNRQLRSPDLVSDDEIRYSTIKPINFLTRTMPDMLVKLYDFDDDWRFMADQKSLGIIIRKPTGVDPAHRGGETGKALLLACLLDMKLKGYGYAVVGAVKDIDFFKKTVGAVEIPDSTPGFYRNRLKGPKSDG